MIDSTTLEKSICNNCDNYVFRKIIPLVPEDWEYLIIDDNKESDEEESLNENTDEDMFDEDDDIIEHYFCKSLSIDLDHVVLECSDYTPKEKCSELIRHKKVFNM